MTEIEQVLELGNPVLYREAKLVSDEATPGLHDVIATMQAVMAASRGVGIAAPQIGHSLQLMLMASRPNPRYPDAPEMEPLILINPQILWQSDEKEKGWEGCLSVPGIRGSVSRPVAVKVGFSTESKEKREADFSGFVARVFFHEYDHLLGLTFLDRVQSSKDLMSEKEFARQVLCSRKK